MPCSLCSVGTARGCMLGCGPNSPMKVSQSDAAAWDSDVVAKWVSVLLANIPQHARDLDFGLLDLAKAAANTGLDDLLISVFDSMSRPHVPPETGYDLDDGSLSEVWKQHLAPHVDKLAERLLNLLIRRLSERHELLRIWRHASREADSDTWHRRAIDLSEDDSHRSDSIDVLVDAARDCLRCLLDSRPPVAAAYLDQMIRADSPLVRRIAVHCASGRSDISVDQKIEWLLSHVSLADRGLSEGTARILRCHIRRRIIWSKAESPSRYPRLPRPRSRIGVPQ